MYLFKDVILEPMVVQKYSLCFWEKILFFVFDYGSYLTPFASR